MDLVLANNVIINVLNAKVALLPVSLIAVKLTQIETKLLVCVIQIIRKTQ